MADSLLVRDFMGTPVTIMSVSDSLLEATLIFCRTGIRHLPLVRVMTRNPVTVEPGTRVADAVAILHREKIGCLPAVEDGRLMGILTVTDMRKLLEQLLGDATPPGGQACS